MPIRVKQNVFGLQVPVNNVKGVQVLQGEHELRGVLAGTGLGEDAVPTGKGVGGGGACEWGRQISREGGRGWVGGGVTKGQHHNASASRTA